MSSPSTAEVTMLLRHILSEDRSAGVREQVEALEVSGGSVTMVDLTVPQGLAAIDAPDGVYGSRAFVLGAGGEEVGELLIWIDVGRLSALEFAWWSDEAPTSLPRPEHVRISPT